MPRLFFALQPRLDQSVALAAQVAPLVTRIKARSVPPENFHTTLCFLGVVLEPEVTRLESVAAGIRGSRATFGFDSLEYWSKPKIICATAPEDDTALPARELAAQLAAAATAAGFSPDVKPFRAHVTLARKVRASTIAADEWPREIAPPVSVHCDRFVLMRSDRGEAGSIYSVVGEWPLYENVPR